MTPAPEPSPTDESDIAALSSELWYIYSTKVPNPADIEMSPQVQPSASHLRQVASNSDAERVASEQRERERLSAEKDRLAAQRREEQQAKEKQRI